MPLRPRRIPENDPKARVFPGKTPPGHCRRDGPICGMFFAEIRRSDSTSDLHRIDIDSTFDRHSLYIHSTSALHIFDTRSTSSRHFAGRFPFGIVDARRNARIASRPWETSGDVELRLHEKSRRHISHRAKIVKNIIPILRNYFWRPFDMTGGTRRIGGPIPVQYKEKNGANDGVRTHDRSDHNRELYR